MDELPVGTAIAGYRILRVAGRGATGVVYVGQHLHLGRVAAVKTLSQDVADDAEFRERFIRESRSAAAIDHPHIVPIYDAGEEDGILYLVMRYVDGADVAQLLERQNGPLEPRWPSTWSSRSPARWTPPTGGGSCTATSSPPTSSSSSTPARPRTPTSPTSA